MLDPRIYRAALVPIVFALIVAAFSLNDRPRPIGTTLQPDVFSAVRANRDLAAWAAAFPDRRAGDGGDAALARRLAQVFRGMGSYQVTTPSFARRDGRRQARADHGHRAAGRPAGARASSSSPTATRSGAARAPSCRARPRWWSWRAWSAAGACTAR